MQDSPIDPQIDLRNGYFDWLSDVLTEPDNVLGPSVQPLFDLFEGFVTDVIEDQFRAFVQKYFDQI